MERRIVTLGIATAVLWGLVFGAVLLTNPTQIGPLGVTLWFLVFGAAVCGLLALGMYFAKGYLKLHDSRGTQLRYSLRQGFLLAAVITVWLALASLRQLSLRDVLLMLILIGLIEFYFRTRRTRND